MNVKQISHQDLKKDKTLYDLLHLADPSKEMIDEYLKVAEIFVAIKEQDIVGIMVLNALDFQTTEIKNIAVKSELQGTGIGSYLIKKAIDIAKTKHQKRICIGTANSSIHQLYLYQKLGFDLYDISINFFIKHYPNPIFENGIQAKHMVMLQLFLDDY